VSSTLTVKPAGQRHDPASAGYLGASGSKAGFPVRMYAVVTLLVLVVTSIPYAAGYLVQTEQIRFTGVVFDVVDTAQYFAWMRSFSDSLLIANPLTPEPGELRFFNLQWWLLGLMAFKTPLGAVITYQILRIVAVIAFAMSIAWFCRLVAPRVERLAFVLIMASSGLGWIWVLEKQWTGELRHPLDVQMAEANTFFSAMAFPHLLIAAAAMVAIFCLALRLHERWLWRDAGLLVPLTLALGFSHGYDLIPTMVIPSATAFVLMVARRAIPRLAFATAIVVAAAALPALYALGLTHLDATWSGVLAQYGNAGVFTPPPHRLVILMGLPFILGLVQLRPGAWAGRSDRELFVRIWFIAGFMLAYIPTDYQIKMLIAYQVPVSILAACTVQEITVTLRGGSLARLRPAMVVSAAVVLLVLMTNVYLTAWRVIDINRLEYPYFLSDGDVVALTELETLVKPGDVVLSSPELGVFVPVYSDGRPYVAHWAQTLSFFERRDTAADFFTPGASDEFREKVIRDNDIRFILYGPAEAGSRAPRPVAGTDFNLLTVMDGSTSIFEPYSAAGSRE
jgi:hypothetical protein